MRNIVIAIVLTAIIAGSVGYLIGVQQAPPLRRGRIFAGSIWGYPSVFPEVIHKAGQYYAEDKEWAFYLSSAELDDVRMSRQLQSYLELGVDALIIGPISEGGQVAIVEDAWENGIPSATFVNDIDSEKVLFRVAPHLYEMGKGLGEVTIEYLRNNVTPIGEVKGTVVMLYGTLERASDLDRHMGFKDQFENYTEVEIIERKYEWKADVAKTKTVDVWTTLEAEGKTLDVIYCHNPVGMMGAIEGLRTVGALHKRGEDGHVFMATIDATPPVLEEIREGYVDYGASWNPHCFVPICMYYLDKYLIEGFDVLPKENDTITAEEIPLTEGEHGDTWAGAPWAPIQVKTYFNHVWLQTNYQIVSPENVDDPSLWANQFA